MNPCFPILIFIALLSISKAEFTKWRPAYSYPQPIPQEIMVDSVNYLGLVLLHAHNQNNENNIALSPYGAASVVVALSEGLQGRALDEIMRASLLPLEFDVIRVGLRDIHRHLKSYFIPEEGFLAGLTFSHDNVTLKPSYESILRFYGYDVDNFNSALYPNPSTTTSPLPATSNAPINQVNITTAPNITTTPDNIQTKMEEEITTTMLPQTKTTQTQSETITSTREVINTKSTEGATNVISTSSVSTSTSTITTAISNPTTVTINLIPTTIAPPTETTVKTEATTLPITITTTGKMFTTSTTTSKPTTTDTPTTTIITTPTITTTTTTPTTISTSNPTTTLSSATTTTEPTTTRFSSATTPTTTIKAPSVTTITIPTPTTTTTPTTKLLFTTTPTTITTTPTVTTTELTTTTEEQTSTETTLMTITSTDSTSSTTTLLSDTPTETPTTTTEENPRISRSVVDYLIARYYDTNAPSHIISRYEPAKPTTFYVNGKIRETNINFMTYDTVLPFRYISYLNALALTFPLDSTKYYLLLVLPIDETGIDALIDNIISTTLKQIIYNLQPTRVKLGIKSIFEPRRADFSKLTDDKDIYVTNIEQAITVTIRNYVDPSTLHNNEIYQRRGPVLFNADHPFLYFVMDSQIHVALMAGKIINPLNSRIR